MNLSCVRSFNYYSFYVWSMLMYFDLFKLAVLGVKVLYFAVLGDLEDNR
jgi:hypothetical protein